jgi:hypothetical protein
MLFELKQDRRFIDIGILFSFVKETYLLYQLLCMVVKINLLLWERNIKCKY